MPDIPASGTLPVFLAELARRPFDAGRSNCFFVCADWVARRTGRDPAAAWRGQIHSAADVRRALRQAGGVENLAAAALAAIGVPRAAGAPAAGDVALVLAPQRRAHLVMRGLTAALCVAPGYYALLTRDRGLVIARLPLVAAWRL